MRRMLKLECPDCEERGQPFAWQHLQMSQDEALPECPVLSGASAREGLSAPSLNRGAVPDTKIKVPDNKTKATDMAMRMISEDNGGANMQSTSRVGEAVAVPVAVRPENRATLDAGWGSAGPPQKRAPMTISTADAMGRGDPAVRNNTNMIDFISRQSAPRLRPSPDHGSRSAIATSGRSSHARHPDQQKGTHGVVREYRQPVPVVGEGAHPAVFNLEKLHGSRQRGCVTAVDLQPLRLARRPALSSFLYSADGNPAAPVKFSNHRAAERWKRRAPQIAEYPDR